MSDFHRDNAWQRCVRDRVLAPGFYGRYAIEGRYVFIDKGRLASILQKRYAVDTIVQGRGGNAVCIEEKIVRWPGWHYPNFCLETHSCTRPGYETDGWMKYGQADFLLYCFHQPDDSLECHLVDFPALQAWFWPQVEKFETFGPLPTSNATMGRKVPILRIHQELPAWIRRVEALSARAAA